MKRIRNNKKEKPKNRIITEDILIYVTIGLLPWLVRLHIVDTNLINYPWYPNIEQIGDFFLYVKSIVFIILSLCMGIMLLDKKLLQRKEVKLPSIFLSLAGYTILIILSTLLSKNRYFSIYGMTEQFESIWILLGYCITVTYCYIVVHKQKQVINILNVVYGSAFVLGLIGVLQFLHLDFFETKLGKYLLIPNALKEYRETVIFNFTATDFNRVYMTLYNPNYVGVYLCMIIPLTIIGVFLCKTVKGKLGLSLLTVILLINLIGCGSKSTLLIIPVLFAFGLYLFRTKIMEHKKILFISVTSLMIVIGIGSFTVGKSYFGRLKDSLDVTRQEYSLTKIQLGKNAVKIVYKGKELYISSEYNEDQTITLYVKDKNQIDLLLKDQPNADGYYCLQDKDYSRLSFLSYEKDGIKYVAFQCNSFKWRFTDANGNGYQYITINGKIDNIVNAPSILNGYETLFTFRGYIWGRTIPILKDYLLIGAGPDQFALVFPQNDYVIRSNMSYGFFTETLTKPHSLYLQIAVQTGVLSLIFFLLFIGLYLRDGFNLLRSKKEFKTIDYMAIAILLSIIGYLLSGLTNDSCIAVAPIFWVLLGVGMSINRMIRQEMK